MLSDSKVTANVPAADLDRARRFYADKLGLTPSRRARAGSSTPPPVGRRSSSTRPSSPARPATRSPSGTSPTSRARWSDLKDKGITFEHYDLPGVTWDGDIATVPEMGRAAWFKDSEGNIMCIDDMTVG